MTLTVLPVDAQATYEWHRYAAAHAQAAAEFTTAVNHYIEIHRLLESPMSSLTSGADLEQIARAREAHRKAIVEARIATPRGDIFTPRVAAFFRHELLMVTGNGRMAEADRTQAALARLPVLPIELEYRFVDRDLVLLDTETLLVVDILENALPPDAALKGSPCAVHPDLEMCWS